MNRIPTRVPRNPLRLALTLAAALLLLTPLAGAVAPELTWVRAFDDLGASQTEAIAVDAQGNVYLTGAFAGTVDFDPGPGIFTLTAQGSQDIFVAKLTAAGALVWARAFFGEGPNEGLAIAVDAQGNVYTTGRFAGSADFDPNVTVFSLTAPGGQGIFVSKLDANGHFVWANAMGGGSSVNDTGYGITVDASGNVYTTGTFSGTTDFDTGPVGHLITAQGGEDTFVRKLDADGNFVWVRAFRGFSSSRPRAIAVDDAGNIYTTGRFQATVDFDPGPVGFPLTAAADHTLGAGDAFVSKLDANGGFVWARALGGPSGDAEGLDLAVDSAGHVHLTGRFIGVVDFDPGPAAFPLTSGILEDAFVAKLTADGDFAWTRRIGNDGSQQGAGVAVDAIGNVYATGDFQGTVDFDPGPDTVTRTAPLDGRSAFVWKLDASGALVWAHANGGPGVSRAFALALDAGGHVLSTGAFANIVDFSPGPNPFPLQSPSSNPMVFVLKLGQGDAIPKGLTGTITNAATGARVSCAVVELTHAGGGRFHAVTDFAGAYFFEPLPPGDYTVRVLAPGFDTLVPPPITLDFAEQTTRDFGLVPAPNRPAAAGQVIDAQTGNPLVGVSAQLVIGAAIVADTLTCANGNYALPLPSGNGGGAVEIEVQFALDNFNPQSRQATLDPAIGGILDAELHASPTGAAVLTGRVIEDAPGTTIPIQGARVTLRGPVNATATTGADGRYEFRTLLDGTYALTASAPLFGGQSVRRSLMTGADATADFRLVRRAAPPPAGPADINRDGVVDAIDVQLVINAALGIAIGEGLDADINGDGLVNAVDVQLVINAALGIAINAG